VVDRSVRIGLAACALVTLLSPNDQLSALAALPVLVLIGYWLVRRRPVAGKARAVEAPAE
jgi:hypothetical protein